MHESVMEESKNRRNLQKRCLLFCVRYYNRIKKIYVHVNCTIAAKPVENIFLQIYKGRRFQMSKRKKKDTFRRLSS